MSFWRKCSTSLALDTEFTGRGQVSEIGQYRGKHQLCKVFFPEIHRKWPRSLPTGSTAKDCSHEQGFVAMFFPRKVAIPMRNEAALQSSVETFESLFSTTTIMVERSWSLRYSASSRLIPHSQSIITQVCLSPIRSRASTGEPGESIRRLRRLFTERHCCNQLDEGCPSLTSIASKPDIKDSVSTDSLEMDAPSHHT